MNKMTTPKFMQFDEAKAIEAYDDSTGQGCFDQCLHMARYQHQSDMVVIKKLMEIVEMQRDALVWVDDCTSDWLLSERISETLAQVETMIKSLD